MSKHDSTTEETVAQNLDETPWRRLASAEPIRVRDPLAEVLGMVPEGEPLVVRFADVAKAAGHACPAVAGGTDRHRSRSRSSIPTSTRSDPTSPSPSAAHPTTTVSARWST